MNGEKKGGFKAEHGASFYREICMWLTRHHVNRAMSSGYDACGKIRQGIVGRSILPGR